MLKLSIDNKRCRFICLYCSPNQTNDQFYKFLDNMELNLEYAMQTNPSLLVVLGDLNAKSKNWYNEDNTTYEGENIESSLSQFGLTQLINQPTHILESSSSCIDLIFTSQPNLAINSGVYPSIHSNSHDQIVFENFNLEIISPPSSPLIPLEQSKNLKKNTILD